MFKKTLLLILLFLLSLVFFLVLLMPISVLWERAIAPNIQASDLPVQVAGFEGTVFDGRALVRYEGVPVLVDWKMILSSILTGGVDLEFEARTSAGEAQGSMLINASAQTIKLSSLNLDLSELSDVRQIKRHRIKLDGTLLSKDLNISVTDQRIESASGKISWSGGDIAYPAGRQLHERSMPAFRGDLGTREDGMIELNIRDAQGSFSVIEGSLLPDGVAQLQVRRRLLDLAEEPWSQNSSEQDVVFKVKKSIY